MSALLDVKNLSVRFDASAASQTALNAVQDVSFTVKKGEFLAIVGESGSGKSVTANAIMRLLPDSAQMQGSILFAGKDLSALSEPEMQRIRGKRISMIFQEPMQALNPLHTIGRQMEEMLQIHQPLLSASQRREKIVLLLADVGLGELKDRLNAYPHSLSGGQRQRVMIAMAMANDPELLIADEPTTALDVTLQAQILGLLKKLQQSRQLSVLMITHDLTIVRELADRVLVMQGGKAVEMANATDLFAAPKADYTRGLLAAIPSGCAVPLPPDAAPVLLAEKICVAYSKAAGFFAFKKQFVPVVEDATLTLLRGQTLGIVGESGSGKSTLALALLRLIAARGSIQFDGKDIASLKGSALKALRAQMQIVFQDPMGSLNPRLTVGQIIGEGLAVHQPKLTSAQRAEKVAQMLEEVGLDASMASRYPHAFSGGQRQRIAIARAMILQPQCVLLDEPTSALDVSIQGQILTLLKRFQEKQGVSYVFISHDLRVIRAISHSVLVMHQGRIIEQGDTQTLFDAPQEAYTKSLIQAAFNPTYAVK
jgi:microcin C transport system ATP-binding protein